MNHIYRTTGTWCLLAATLAFALPNASAHGGESISKPDSRVLWYAQPAGDWMEAMPLGNGRMAGMVFGSVAKERLLLNEESLWAGEPMEAWPEDFYGHWREVQRLVLEGKEAEAEQYGIENLTARPTYFRAYQPFGDVWIEMDHGDEAEDYRRDLNLRDGLASVGYTVDGTRFRREMLISAVDDVVAVRLTADQPGQISARIRMDRDWEALASVRNDWSRVSQNIPQQRVDITTGGNNRILLDGQVVDDERDQGGRPGGVGDGGERMKFAGRLLAQTDGGTLEAGDKELIVEGADEVLLLVVVATDYNLQKLNFDRSIDAGRLADSGLAEAAGKSWERMLADHLEEHRGIMDRVELRLGTAHAEDEAADARLTRVQDGDEDPVLDEQLFHYGRYLLMSSSRRPGRLPANLQGIWNIHMWPPWMADYHLNINMQMNYWPTQICNLEETMAPLNDWFRLTAERGRETAQRYYRADGWVLFHASNVFGRATPAASSERSQFINGALDPMGGAWMALTWWRHYEFTGDETFLRENAYPLLKGAAEFLLDYLHEDEEGRLLAVPSTSPENTYRHPETGAGVRVTRGSTYHNAVSRMVFDRVIRGSERLGVDDAWREEVRAAMQKIPDHQIGDNGTIQEWLEDYQEVQPGHRHISHLIGLQPFELITPDQPELFEAAVKTVERRIQNQPATGGVGWAHAKQVNVYARLRDGDAAHGQLIALQRNHTADNLLNLCFNRRRPLFQIDGSFGVTAGVAEMLVQSHRGGHGDWIIDVLPALPSAWLDGEVTGLRARGDFTVSVAWEDGVPERVTIKSGSGKVCRLSFGAHTEGIRFPTEPGGTYVITGITAETMRNSKVHTEAGTPVEITPSLSE